MARKNARQKRAAKRRIALTELANLRNPSTQATEGHVRDTNNRKATRDAVRDNALYVGVSAGMREANWEGQGRDVKVIRKGGKVVKMVPKRPAKAKATHRDFPVVVERNVRTGAYETQPLHPNTVLRTANRIASKRPDGGTK